MYWCHGLKSFSRKKKRTFKAKDDDASKNCSLARLDNILRILIYSQFWKSAYITTPDFSPRRRLKMKQAEVDCCCELGVKGSCVTCDYYTYCNGKWSHKTGKGAGAEAKLKISPSVLP